MTAVEWDLAGVVSQDELGSLEAPISAGDGQSLSVAPLTRNPSFLFKRYKTPGDRRESVRLDELIAHPGSDPLTAKILRERTSWPVARVRDESGGALGCVIPRAPEHFLTDVIPIGAKSGHNAAGASLERRYLEVDLLAAAPERLTRLGVQAPSLDQRMAAVRSVVEIAAALEKLRLVYSDWSYSNAFWSPRANAVYVIDIDGCASGSTSNVYQPNWEDPLTPRSDPADTYVERYRVALLVARCLTGQRGIPQVVTRLQDSVSPVCGATLREVLLDMILVNQRRHRPSVSILEGVLQDTPYLRFPGRQRIDVPVVDLAKKQPVTPPAPKHANPPVTPPAQPPTTMQSRYGLPALVALLVTVLIVVTVLAVLSQQ